MEYTSESRVRVLKVLLALTIETQTDPNYFVSVSQWIAEHLRGAKDFEDCPSPYGEYDGPYSAPCWLRHSSADIRRLAVNRIVENALLSDPPALTAVQQGWNMLTPITGAAPVPNAKGIPAPLAPKSPSLLERGLDWFR